MIIIKFSQLRIRTYLLIQLSRYRSVSTNWKADIPQLQQQQWQKEEGDTESKGGGRGEKMGEGSWRLDHVLFIYHLCTVICLDMFARDIFQ